MSEHCGGGDTKHHHNEAHHAEDSVGATAAPPHTALLARKIARRRKDGLVQRHAAGDNGVAAGADQAVANAASASSGAPLGAEQRQRFEGSLGVSLADVRVHTGAASAAATEAVGARAYTTGSDIHFNSGEYNPSSKQGEHLLAHEVAHTVQQRGGGGGGQQAKMEVSTPGDSLEVEADRVADAMVSGSPATVSEGGANVQRAVAATDEGSAVEAKGPPATGGGEGAEEGEAIELGGLALAGSLEGHAFLQRAPGKAAAKKVTATIPYTPNAATVDNSKTAAQIATKHSKPGIAGYTTPSYTVGNPTGNSTNINIPVTMDWKIEVGSDYTGGRGDVLRDHEQGHVTIGDKRAREHFVTGIKTELEAKPKLDRNNVKAALDTAVAAFKKSEGDDGKAYDTTDYPRMTEAYKGVSKSGADMAKSSPKIATMAKALDGWNDNSVVKDVAADDVKAAKYAQAVVDGKAGLSADELAGLQYNPDFKVKVATSKERVTDYRRLRPKPNDDAEAKLTALSAALDGFTWTPKV